jgi:hypothetical protein
MPATLLATSTWSKINTELYRGFAAPEKHRRLQPTAIILNPLPGFCTLMFNAVRYAGVEMHSLERMLVESAELSLEPRSVFAVVERRSEMNLAASSMSGSQTLRT